MWYRKNYLDHLRGRNTPLPTQIVSNEEFYPLPQTHDQKRVEHRMLQLADDHSKRLGLSRREFLKTTGGMATAFLALNEVFGDAFTVHAAEVMESDAYRELWPKKEFIFDAQTHHVKESISGPLAFRKVTSRLGLNSALAGISPTSDTLHRTNFVKEIFFDSDTVMAIMSGAAIGKPEDYTLPIADMVGTRNLVNEAAGTQRMLSHGIVDPRAPNVFEEQERQVRELGIDGWKLYTGNSAAPWKFTDQDVAYPFLENSRDLGILNISTHKGLPLGKRSEPWFMPDDIPQVAKDFRDMNFIIYHSGMKNMMAQLPPGYSGVGDDGYIAWTTDLCQARREDPDMTNVYCEIGGVFGFSVITHPEICGHLMGQIIGAFGADHVIWGTDCIWWGSPQWLIEAFRRFQIPENLQEQFGYAPITARDKELIFGKNLAKLYGVDINEARKAIPGDALSEMKTAYQDAGPAPSNTTYGWVTG